MNIFLNKYPAMVILVYTQYSVFYVHLNAHYYFLNELISINYFLFTSAIICITVY